MTPIWEQSDDIRIAIAQERLRVTVVNQLPVPR
jgi:hypothetical protein